MVSYKIKLKLPAHIKTTEQAISFAKDILTKAYTQNKTSAQFKEILEDFDHENGDTEISLELKADKIKDVKDLEKYLLVMTNDNPSKFSELPLKSYEVDMQVEDDRVKTESEVIKEFSDRILWLYLEVNHLQMPLKGWYYFREKNIKKLNDIGIKAEYWETYYKSSYNIMEYQITVKDLKDLEELHKLFSWKHEYRKYYVLDNDSKEVSFSDSEINSPEKFKEYAHESMKTIHGDNYDEELTNKVSDGLISKHGENYGAMIGTLKNSQRKKFSIVEETINTYELSKDRLTLMSNDLNNLHDTIKRLSDEYTNLVSTEVKALSKELYNMYFEIEGEVDGIVNILDDAKFIKAESKFSETDLNSPYYYSDLETKLEPIVEIAEGILEEWKDSKSTEPIRKFAEKRLKTLPVDEKYYPRIYLWLTMKTENKSGKFSLVEDSFSSDQSNDIEFKYYLFINGASNLIVYFRPNTWSGSKEYRVAGRPIIQSFNKELILRRISQFLELGKGTLSEVTEKWIKGDLDIREFPWNPFDTKTTQSFSETQAFRSVASNPLPQNQSSEYSYKNTLFLLKGLLALTDTSSIDDIKNAFSSKLTGGKVTSNDSFEYALSYALGKPLDKLVRTGNYTVSDVFLMLEDLKRIYNVASFNDLERYLDAAANKNTTSSESALNIAFSDYLSLTLNYKRVPMTIVAKKFSLVEDNKSFTDTESYIWICLYPGYEIHGPFTGTSILTEMNTFRNKYRSKKAVDVGFFSLEEVKTDGYTINKKGILGWLNQYLDTHESSIVFNTSKKFADHSNDHQYQTSHDKVYKESLKTKIKFVRWSEVKIGDYISNNSKFTTLLFKVASKDPARFIVVKHAPKFNEIDYRDNYAPLETYNHIDPDDYTPDFIVPLITNADEILTDKEKKYSDKDYADTKLPKVNPKNMKELLGRLKTPDTQLKPGRLGIDWVIDYDKLLDFNFQNGVVYLIGLWTSKSGEDSLGLYFTKGGKVISEFNYGGHPKDVKAVFDQLEHYLLNIDKIDLDINDVAETNNLKVLKETGNFSEIESMFTKVKSDEEWNLKQLKMIIDSDKDYSPSTSINNPYGMTSKIKPGLKNVRSWLRDYRPDFDESTKSDQEVSKYINSELKNLKDEARTVAIRTKYSDKLDLLFKTIDIRVYGQVSVAKSDAIKFTEPLLKEHSMEEIISLLEGSKTLYVDVKSRYAKSWEVFYSGTISNDREESLDFKNISNGFAVQMG